MSKTIKLPGRIESTETGNVVALAKHIYDDAKGKKQSVINSEVDTAIEGLNSGKQDVLTFDNAPTEGSNNPVMSGGVYSANLTLSQAIVAILLLIPSAATALNQLADKAFVNSSIATDTATFRGTSAAGLSEQQFLAWANTLEHDLNDYVFWNTVDNVGNIQFKRYKWNGTAWAYEYTLNNSSFTADQWAAINSTITLALVQKLSALPTASELQIALNAKQDTLTFDNTPTAGSNNPVKSSGLYKAFATVQGLIDALTGRMTDAEGNIATNTGNIATNTADIALLQGLYEALTQSALVVVEPTDTWPVANPATKTIYRVVDRVNTPPQYYSDYMWNGSAMVLMATYNNAIDDVPEYNSNNLVKSNGVFDQTNVNNDYPVSIYTGSNYQNGNYLINSAGSYVFMDPNTYGHCRTTQRIALQADKEYLFYSGAASFVAAYLKASFSTLGTDDGGTKTVYPLQGTENNLNASGVIPVGQYYRQGYRYIAVEFLRGGILGQWSYDTFVLTYNPFTPIKEEVVNEKTKNNYLNAGSVQNIFNDNIILPGNNALDGGTVSSYDQEKFGYCRVTVPLEIPENEEYLCYHGLYAHYTDILINVLFTTLPNGDYGTKSLYTLRGTNQANASGVIPVGEYYRQGYRYIIVELVTGGTGYSDLNGILLGWGKTSVYINKEFNKTDSIISSIVDNFFVSKTMVQNGNYSIHSSSPYDILTMDQSTYGICRITKPIEIPSDQEYLLFNGIQPYGGVKLKARFSTLDTDAGGSNAIYMLVDGNNNGLTSGVIPVGEYYRKGYRYIIIELTRGSSTAVDLSSIILGWGRKVYDELKLFNRYKNRFTRDAYTTPRRPCFAFQYDVNDYDNIIEYANVLASKGVPESSFLIRDMHLNSNCYVKNKHLYNLGNEMAWHGSTPDDTNFQYNLEQGLMRMYLNFDVLPKGMVESQTRITPESLVIAKNYFQWIVGRGLDYAWDIDGYLDAIHSISDKPYELKRLGIEMTPQEHADSTQVETIIANIKEAIDQTISTKGFLVFYCHSYNVTTNPNIGYTLYPDVLNALLDYLYDKMKYGHCFVGRTDELVEYFWTKRMGE